MPRQANSLLALVNGDAQPLLDLLHAQGNLCDAIVPLKNQGLIGVVDASRVNIGPAARAQEGAAFWQLQRDCREIVTFSLDTR